MSGVPELVEATPRWIAAVRRRATAATVGQLIRTSGVWDLMGAQGITSPGHNIVIYWHTLTDRLDAPGGIDVDIGADVTARFDGRDGLTCVATPAGRAVHLKHFGPYDRLEHSYDAMARFVLDRGLAFGGAGWEIYGHWNDNPDLLETDVFRLVA